MTTSESIAAAETGAQCAHFGDCGGCQSQDIPYEEQLREKERVLGELFGDVWDQPIGVTASPIIWNYRNKVDFNFAPRQYDEPPPKDFVRDTVLGFTRKGQWYWPLDIGECKIGPHGTQELMEAVRAWYRTENLRAFDSRSKEGMLRVLLVRESKRTGQRMVVLITSSGELDCSGFVEVVRSSYAADSVYWGVSGGSARGAFAESFELLDGAATIDEELHIGESDPHVLKFRISPFGFFQTNTLAAEVLYAKIRAWVAEVGPKILYDLYGGSGGIALSCADLVDVVRSVENVESASVDGEYNAEVNGVQNVHFVTQPMKTYLLQVREDGGMESTSAAIVDPPRAGMTPKPLRRLIESGPRNILYVSCNPSVLAEEMKELLKHYELREMSAVDLFPHTPHVEVLASLERRSQRT